MLKDEIEKIILQSYLWGMVSANFGVDLAEKGKRELATAILELVEKEKSLPEVIALNSEGNTYGCPHCGRPIRKDGSGRKVCPCRNQTEDRMKKKDFYKIAKNKWGLNFILDMLIEESAELIQSIQHFKRRKEGSFIEILEETADVEIIIENFKVCLLGQIAQYNSIKKKKLQRAMKRLL